MKAIVLMAVLGLFASCGGHDGGEPDLNQSLPHCDEIWVVGKTLPEDYQGCVRNGDEIVAVIVGSDGKTVAYDDQFQAVRGGTIEEMK